MNPGIRVAVVCAALLYVSGHPAPGASARAQGLLSIVEEAATALEGLSDIVGLESVEARMLAARPLSAEGAGALAAKFAATGFVTSSVSDRGSTALQNRMDQRWRAIAHLGPDYELEYYKRFARLIDGIGYFDALDKLHHAELDALVRGGVDWKTTPRAAEIKRLIASVALQVREGRRLAEWAAQRPDSFTLKYSEPATMNFQSNLDRLQLEVAEAARLFQPAVSATASKATPGAGSVWRYIIASLGSLPPILHGYQAPPGTRIYDLVVDRNRAVYIVGTRLDLEHLLAQSAAVNVRLANTAWSARKGVSKGDWILHRLNQMPARLYTGLYDRVEPGHVLVLITRDLDLVNLAQHVREIRRKEDGDRPGSPNRAGIKPADKNKEAKRCEHVGKICFDTKGHVTVGLGCEGGVEVEASTSGEFEMSMPVSGAKITLTGKQPVNDAETQSPER